MRVVRTVAAREFLERVRSRSFLVANAFIGGLILLVVLLPGFIDRAAAPTRIGTLDDPGAVVVAEAVAAAEAARTERPPVPVVRLADRAAAEAALRADRVDVVLLDATTGLAGERFGPARQGVVDAVVGAVALERLLADAGVDADLRAAIADPPGLTVERVAGSAAGLDVESPAVLVATAASFLLYGLLALFGQWVAQGIVEEKQSRVVEVLLGAVRPSQLLAGRIVGLGALGLFQISVLAGAGAVGIAVSDVLRLPRGGWGSLALAVAWYVPGFALYALLFAVAGAVVSRVEDLQSAVLIPTVVLIAAIVAAQLTIVDPGADLARVARYVPFTAPIVQPILIASGLLRPLDVVIGLGGALATIALATPVTARLYRGGVLPGNGGGLRSAWRAGR